MKTKHTPGPWSAGRTIIVHANTLAKLGASIGFINTSDEERNAIAKANSHLIAAAPDLLEALQAINAHWEAGNFSRREELWAPMREAIAKATGEQQ